MSHNVVGVIPARLDSTRLFRKALRPLCGRPMVEWVYRHAAAFRGFHRLLVATDSVEIQDYCGAAGILALLTSPDHHSGTDRVHEIMTRLAAEIGPEAIYVNIQGDEPMVTASHIELLVQAFDTSQTQVSTLKVAISEEAARHPGNVKVVTDPEGHALYFSRALIPCHRDDSCPRRYFKHLGLYAYRTKGLDAFHSLPPSPLELTERLEQLRFLENGIPVKVMETPLDTIGVDTEEDVERVEEHLRSMGEVLS
ncbi:MAG: 3-deoxy-manno-octulosonate cytidylyltransferase [Terriglobia bacterium]